MARLVERRAPETGGHRQAIDVMVSVKCVLWWPCLALGEKEPLRQPETPTRVQSWVGDRDRQHSQPGDDSIPQPPLRQGPSKGPCCVSVSHPPRTRVSAAEDTSAGSCLEGRISLSAVPMPSLRTQLELVPGTLSSSRGPPPFAPQTPHTTSRLATLVVTNRITLVLLSHGGASVKAHLPPKAREAHSASKRCALSQSRHWEEQYSLGLPGNSGECDGGGPPGQDLRVTATPQQNEAKTI